jgi:hypothetical protein
MVGFMSVWLIGHGSWNRENSRFCVGSVIVMGVGHGFIEGLGG